MSATSRLRVLVIDDDVHIRESLAFVLHTMGHATILAGSAADSIAKFVEHRPPLVITDMLMPGAPGVEAVRAIRKLSANTVIIAMLGSDDDDLDSMLAAARAAGADYCLGKPFDLAEFEDLFAGIAVKIGG
jgi:CheY-like chemotaxis protein